MLRGFVLLNNDQGQEFSRVQKEKNSNIQNLEIHGLMGLCHGSPGHFVLLITSPCSTWKFTSAKKLLVNDSITALNCGKQ